MGVMYNLPTPRRRLAYEKALGEVESTLGTIQPRSLPRDSAQLATYLRWHRDQVGTGTKWELQLRSGSDLQPMRPSRQPKMLSAGHRSHARWYACRRADQPAMERCVSGIPLNLAEMNRRQRVNVAKLRTTVPLPWTPH